MKKIFKRNKTTKKLKKSLNALSHHCKTSSSLTNMTIRWHHFHWHIAWDCKKMSQNAHIEYIVFVNCHLLVTVSRVVTIAETFLTPSCFSPRSNSCVFSSLVVRLSWQWGGSKVENCLEIYPDTWQGRPEGETGAFKWEDGGGGKVGGNTGLNISWNQRIFQTLTFLSALQKEIVSFWSWGWGWRCGLNVCWWCRNWVGLGVTS